MCPRVECSHAPRGPTSTGGASIWAIFVEDTREDFDCLGSRRYFACGIASSRALARASISGAMIRSVWI